MMSIHAPHKSSRWLGIGALALVMGGAGCASDTTDTERIEEDSASIEVTATGTEFDSGGWAQYTITGPDDISYSVEYMLSTADDGSTAVTIQYGVERGSEFISGAIDYTLAERDGQFAFESVDPEHEAEVLAVINEALYGTSVDDFIDEGMPGVDWESLIPESTRGIGLKDDCPSFWDVAFTCGLNGAACLASAGATAGLASLAVCGIGGGQCGYVAGQYAACR